MAGLDNSIRSLLKVIGQIQNHGSMGVFDLTKSSKPYWHLCIEKFHAAYIKAKNPDGFRDMFNNFFKTHEDQFTDSILDDGDINDEWLKNKEVLSSNKKSKKKSSDDLSFSLKNINCRGEVIYFDESNEKIRNVCIPIGEAYLAACKIYADGAKKGEYSPLPAQLLLSLFTVMKNVVDEEYQEDITENITSLKDIIESLTGEDEDESETTTGSTLNPLTDAVKNMASKFGLGGKDGSFDPSGMEKMITGIFNDDMMNKAKSIFGKFTDKVNLSENADLGTIISNVSDAFKDTDIQNEITETLGSVAKKIGFGEIKFTEDDNKAINGEGTEADAQE